MRTFLVTMVLAGALSACGSTDTSGTVSTDVSAETCAALTDTWSNYASGFFQSNCSQCHSWASSYSSIDANSSAIEGAIANGSMPPKGGLSTTEQQRAVNWLACGLPQ